MDLPSRTTAVISAFAVLGALFVGLRLWTRLVIIRAAGWEDWVLVFSWLNAVVTVICIGTQVHYGLGKHADELSDNDNEMILFNTYISISTYCASIGLTKLAILLQYYRVFPTPRFRLTCLILIVLMAGYTIATVLACIFVCVPVHKFWQPVAYQGKGTCIDTLASWLSNAILNVVTDVVIIAVPMPVVRSLRLRKRQKRLLVGVFGFGGIVCIISIIRLHSLITVTHSTDLSHDNAVVASFSVVEVNVAIICACLPTLRPLLSKWVSGLQNSTGQRTATTQAACSSSGAPNTLSHSRHGRRRSSILGAMGSYGMALDSLGNNRGRGVEKLGDGEDSEGGGNGGVRDAAREDGIRVVTKIDVDVGDGDGKSVGEERRDERESSTEILFGANGRAV